MKINVPIVLDDEQRRRVRAGLDRGGVATRRENRLFVTRAVDDALAALPEPKRRGRAKPANLFDETPARKQTAAEAAPPDATCAGCGKPKSEHHGARLDCPLSRRVKPGSRFQVAA